MKRKFIVFDTETNGMSNCSLLSISALKIEYDFESKKMVKLATYDRYYYRSIGETINYYALKVHGLTDEVIRRRRASSSYAEYFLDDIEAFIEFVGDTKHFIAHNISFDKSFVPIKMKHEFCTMLNNVEVAKIRRKNGGYKWPKLSELAEFYNIPYDESKLHGSLYDTTITARVVFRMSQNPIALQKLEGFLYKD